MDDNKATRASPAASEADAELEVFTVEETTRILKIGRNQTYEAIRDGKLPSFRVGKRILVSGPALRRLIAGRAA